MCNYIRMLLIVCAYAMASHVAIAQGSSSRQAKAAPDPDAQVMFAQMERWKAARRRPGVDKLNSQGLIRHEDWMCRIGSLVQRRFFIVY